MSFQSLLGILSKYTLATRIIKGLAACLLGLGTLAWIVDHAGSEYGEAVVHVTEPDVEVVVSGRTYRIEGRAYDPIVCRLPRGRHELIMRRAGQILHQETFTIQPGQSLVLTAWDPLRAREGADPRRGGR
jgi:hypothetical protein